MNVVNSIPKKPIKNNWNILIVFLLVFAAVQFTVSVPDASAACSALPSDKGQATMTISVPSQASYRVWSRIYSPSANVNGYYLQIDQSVCSVTVGKSATIPVGQFTWVDYQSGATNNKINVNLAAGNHTLILAGLDSGLSVDKILLLADTACIPTGTGTNCESSSTPVPSVAPGGGGTKPTSTPTSVVIGGGLSKTPVAVSGTITLSSGNVPAGSTVTYKVDGKSVNGSQLNTKSLQDGVHTIEAIVTAPDGTVTTKTQKIKVQNGWYYTLAAQIRVHALTISILFVGLVLVLASFIFYLMHGGFVPRVRKKFQTQPAHMNDTIKVDDTPAESQVVYPANWESSFPSNDKNEAHKS